MSADGGYGSGGERGQLQCRALGDGVWVHLPALSPEAVGSIEVDTPIPAVVIDLLVAPQARPQRTVVPGWTVWSLRPVGFRIDPAVVDAGHLVIAVGPGVVITVGQLPDAMSTRLSQDGPGLVARPLPAGDGLAVSILGDLLEDVGAVVADLDDEVEDVEMAVFASGRRSLAERIYRLKREVQTVRRSIGPLPELLAVDGAGRDGAGTHDSAPASAQLSARSRRLVEQLIHIDELLDSMLAAHLTQVAIQQNDDMRRISAWVAIVAAPTLMASIYGMNFRSMPELGWQFGYPLVLGTMLVVCTGLYRLFRRSGWL